MGLRLKIQDYESELKNMVSAFQSAIYEANASSTNHVFTQKKKKYKGTAHVLPTLIHGQGHSYANLFLFCHKQVTARLKIP
jgi:hypothetical protein